MIIISLTGNFSSMIFGSLLSIIRKILQKIYKKTDWLRKKIKRDWKLIR